MLEFKKCPRSLLRSHLLYVCVCYNGCCNFLSKWSFWFMNFSVKVSSWLSAWLLEINTWQVIGKCLSSSDYFPKVKKMKLCIDFFSFWCISFPIQSKIGCVALGSLPLWFLVRYHCLENFCYVFSEFWCHADLGSNLDCNSY